MSTFLARARLRRFSPVGASRSTTPCGRPGPDGDLLHVDVGGVEEPALIGERDDGHAIGRALGDDLGAFQRIDRDIHLLAALADLLADVEHRALHPSRPRR